MLYSVLSPCFCQRHRAGCNFSTRKEEVYTFKPYASQPRSHAFYCMRVYIISCDTVGRGRATPPDQAKRQSCCCTEGAPGSEHSGPWHAPAKSQPLPTSAQRSSPSHWALHIAFSCRWIHLVPEEEQSTLQATAWSLCFRLLFIQNTSLWVFIRCHKIRFGEKERKNFSLASQLE